MEFPEEWFDDEVRDGFYVSSIVKREWAARLEVLNEISNVCERHHLRWFMAFGSMLGAIRHHGFIPWDDDMDIFMPQDDYNSFIHLAPYELPKNHIISDERKPGYHEFVSVIGENIVPQDTNDFQKRFHDYPYPPSIDVFRLDYISDNKEDEDWRDGCVQNVLYTIQSLRKNEDKISQQIQVDVDHVTLKDMKSFEETDWAKQVMNGLTLSSDSTGHKFNQEEPLLDQLFLLYEALASYFKPEEGSRVAYLIEWIQDPNRKYNCYPKEMINHLIKVPFENMMVNVPEDYQYHLVMRFGQNYMKPVKAGGTHPYPSFRKIQKQALAGAGYPDTNPLEYSFSEKDIAERPSENVHPKESVRKLLAVMEKLHGTLYKIAQPQNIELMIQVLESCQNAAQQIGDCIEKARDEKLANQLSIQEYADAAFQCYEEIVNQGQIPSGRELDAFRQAFESMRTAVEDKFLNRKEVVFMPYTARKWNAMESLWRACKADPNCDVYVVPVPHYVKDMTAAVKPEQYYDLEKYSEELHAVSYKDYDTWKRYPDYIFIQNPYDQYNYVTTIEQTMYSKLLYYATDHLVYIPWFMTCEFDMDSHDDVAAMEFYVKVPGVVRADLTVVQSEKIADNYRQYLTEIAGEKTKELWNRKIQGWGSPLQDAPGAMSPLWEKIKTYFAADDAQEHVRS